MENMQLYIVLAITAFMIISFVVGKIPYGVTTMTCCALLAITGYYDVPQAFSGLCNKTTILIAGMFTLAYAFGKTSLINRIRAQMTKIKGKSGLVLLACMFGIAIVLAQLMGRTAVLSIMILFATSLSDDDELCPSRVITAVFVVIAAWSLKVPIAAGATMSATANAYYEGIVSDPAMMLQTGDFFKVAIIPCIALTIYALFAWKLIPKHPIDSSNVKEVKMTEAIPKKDEICIIVVFVGVMIAFFFGTKLGNLMNLAPAIGVLILIYTGSLTAKEAITNMTGDMVWMIAGVLVVSDAMGSSGVGELIGSGILKILGDSPSGLVVMVVFAVVAIVMTTFMSNTGTAAILSPIAASMALAGGMDPRGIVLIVNIASIMAVAFPSGSAECALMFAAGRHSPVGLLKFTLPYLLIAVVTLVISASIFFPVYPG